MSPPSASRPRLVATDLDGTFLRSDGTVSERTARVWNALPHGGIETVIVTARPPRWLHDLEHVVGPRGVAICGNGAFVYEVARRRLVRTQTFDPEVVRSIAADLRAAIPGISFAAEGPSGCWLEPGWPHPHKGARDPGTRHGEAPLGSRGSGVGGGDDGTDEPVGKLLALAPGVPTGELLVTVQQVLGERGHLAYSGAGGLAEINPFGVTKAEGLRRWCLELGIAAHEVWSFGDMPNDIPMLAWSGRSFAVAGGHPDALAAATDSCPSNDDDGVAVTLEPLLA